MKRKKNRRNIKIWRRKLVRISKFIWRNSYRFFLIGAIAFFLLFFSKGNYYQNLQLVYKPPLVRGSEYDNFLMSPFPKRLGQEVFPAISSESVEILDLKSFATLFEINSNEHLRPASTTKLMTALVAIEHYPLDQVLIVKRLAAVDKNSPESEMGLHVGDSVSVLTLLYGLLVPSGNDAAYTLADNYPGGLENFISMMNQRARELHMFDTHFDNPVGIDSPGQFTSAHDLALLSAKVLENDLINKIVSTSSIILNENSGKRQYVVKNVNQLLGQIYGMDGVKTGYTDEAGQCLISSVSRNGHRVIFVVLKSFDRFDDTQKLVGWVFRNYVWIDVNSKK